MKASDSQLELFASGVLWDVDIDVFQELDWLDRVLLEVTREPTTIDSLLKVFPSVLPTRLMEDALGRLVEHNLLLLDVAKGSVQGSDLDQAERTTDKRARSEVAHVPTEGAHGRREKLAIWQDHATGQLVRWEQVKPWHVDAIPSGARALRRARSVRTPLEMSDGELLHLLERYRPESRPTDMINAVNYKGLKTIKVQVLQRDDGRLALLDEIPRDLRLRWARLPEMTHDVDISGLLPLSWQQAVNAWAELVEGVLRGAAPEDADELLGEHFKMIREALRSESAVVLSTDSRRDIETLSRNSQQRVVVSVSGRRGSVGRALEVLALAPCPRRWLLTEPGMLRDRHTERMKVLGLEHKEIAKADEGGEDFVLIDDRILAFGGLDQITGRGIILRTHAPLRGVVSWLEGLGLPRTPFTSGHHGDLLDRLEQLRQEVVEVRRAWTRLALNTNLAASKDYDPEALVRELDLVSGRMRSLEALFREMSCPPVASLAADELAAIVAAGGASVRFLLAPDVAANESLVGLGSAEYASWPTTTGNGPAEVCLIGDVLLFGCWRSPAGPDFVALYDPHAARELRLESDRFPHAGPSATPNAEDQA